MEAAATEINASGMDAETTEFYELAYRLSHIARRQMHLALAAHNLTPPQYAVLKIASKSPQGTSVTDLAEAAGMLLPTATGILNRLEERGLAVRQRSPLDRRTQLVTVTPQALLILKEFEQHTRAGIKTLLAQVSPDDRQFLLRVLRELTAKFTLPE